MKKESFAYPALIIIAGIAAYSNSFCCSFHFDDFPNIVSNSAIWELSDWRAWMLFNPYRPVAFFTFALNYHFGLLDVFGYHLVNLGIHLLNALLLWELIRLMFSSPYLAKHPLSASAGNIAFFTALIFAVHPLMTESVTYIVQRLVSLASMFCLLSLVLFTKGLLSLRPSLRIGFLLGAGFSALLGFFTKEIAWTLPLLMLILYFFFFFRADESRRRPGRVLLIAMFGFLILLAGAAIGSGKYFHLIPPREGHPYFITPARYYYTQINVIFTYLRLIFLPVNQTLDYNYPVTLSLANPHVLVKLAGLVILISAAAWLYKRERLVSFGLSWFFITIAPQCLVPRSNFIFEHRVYLSAAGIILAWVLLFYYLFGRVILVKRSFLPGMPGRGQVVLSLASLLLLLQCGVLGWMTRERNKVWTDEYTLWSDCLSKAPGSARAMVNLGGEQVGRQEYAQAISNFSRAIMIFPLYMQAWSSRAAARIDLGDNEKAVEELNFALLQIPGFADAYINRGIAFRNLKQFDASVSDFTTAISLKPISSDIYFQRALSFWMAGRNEAALKDFMLAASMKNQDAIGFLQKNLR